MQSTSSEAQVTQAGQAIAINNITCQQLFELFAPMYGPHGTIKALVNGGQILTLTKDGGVLSRDVNFTHPTSMIITKTAADLYASVGDGIISFMLLSTGVFMQGHHYYAEGTSIPQITNSLQAAFHDSMGFLRTRLLPINDSRLHDLAISSLRTKLYKADKLAEIVVNAFMHIKSAEGIDLDMIEIMRMNGGDINDSAFIEGLVLDHAGRHARMPSTLNNVCVMITNMSLEYERPEVNAEFCYHSAAQRSSMAEGESKFIAERAHAIAAFALELRATGRSLIVINEKGIDLVSLDILADAGVLALRRAKRRNLERLISMCGGSIITQPSQILPENMGSCRSVKVTQIGEDKFTFIEGTPLKGACTILLRGNVDSERYNRSVRGTLLSLYTAVATKCCIAGGIPLYKALMDFLDERAKAVHAGDVVGYRMLRSAYENLIKTLLRNEGANIHEQYEVISRGEYAGAPVVENIRVVGDVMNNAVVTAITLLMCDEIIKAGKPIKQDKMENNQ